MSLALSANNKKNYARLNITFFYFILATFQYIITIVIFFDKFIFLNNLKFVTILIIGIAIGNLISSFVDSKIYRIIVNVIAMLSAIFLVIS